MYLEQYYKLKGNSILNDKEYNVDKLLKINYVKHSNIQIEYRQEILRNDFLFFIVLNF